MSADAVDLEALRAAIEASWGADTSYAGTFDHRNPAYGQCYPTARVVQHFVPSSEIARGWVDTGVSVERHFWNVDGSRAIDLTWQQFPNGSRVTGHELLDRADLGDGAEMIRRCELLLRRVSEALGPSFGAAVGSLGI